MNFFEADCRKGRDGHVQGFEQRPPLDEMIAERPDQNEKNRDGNDQQQPDRQQEFGSVHPGRYTVEVINEELLARNTSRIDRAKPATGTGVSFCITTSFAQFAPIFGQLFPLPSSSPSFRAAPSSSAPSSRPVQLRNVRHIS